jgi:hypothetical protein
MGGMGPLPEGPDYKYIQVLQQLKAGMRNFTDIGQVGNAGWTFFYKPAQDGEPAMVNRNRCNKKTSYTDRFNASSIGLHNSWLELGFAAPDLGFPEHITETGLHFIYGRLVTVDR